MLHVSSHLLPSSPSEQHARLRDYFCDIDAYATEAAGGWDLSLAWPAAIDRHVDLELLSGLSWWGDGTSPSTMVYARRRRGRILTSLYDTWTLQSWSEWLSRRPDAQTESVIILHVDDHRDLAAPRLFIESDGWVDAISGCPVDLRSPATVEAAILSGAIGMGSFLTPFLHACPHAEVRHLCQPPKVTRTQDYLIRTSELPDTLLRPGAPRPAIDLIPSPVQVGSGFYRATCEHTAWLENLGPGPILLHIDMDYFNNRYDGDSHWRMRSSAGQDASEQEIQHQIAQLLAALRNSGASSRIEDVVISYSPGFFPAELWQDSDERLRTGLETIL